MKTFPVPVVIGVGAAALILGIILGRHMVAEQSPARSGTTAEAGAFKSGSDQDTSEVGNAGSATTASTGAGWEPLTESSAVPRLRAAIRKSSEMGRLLRALAVASQLKPEEIPAALQFADTLDEQERMVLGLGVIDTWAETDPRAAADWIASRQSSGSQRTEMLELCLAEWTAREPVEARAWIDRLSGDLREGAMRGYLAQMARENPLNAIQEAAAVDESARSQAYRAIFRTWGGSDPVGAANAALQMVDAENQPTAMSAVVNAWMAQSPASAIAWIDQLPEGSLRSSALSDGFSAWARKDPDAAMNRLLGYPEPVREDLVRDVMDSVASIDLKLAERLAQRIPAGPVRQAAFGKVAREWSEQNPERALQLESELAPTDISTRAEIVWNWVGKDPTAAGAWVAQAPESELRREASDRLLQRWAYSDPVASAKWIEQLPLGPSRDSAVAAYSSTTKNRDPAAALEWAVTITDETLRESKVGDAFEAWKRRDASSAREWLEQTDTIRDDLRTVLLRKP
jgi:hypothetical protein